MVTGSAGGLVPGEVGRKSLAPADCGSGDRHQSNRPNGTSKECEEEGSGEVHDLDDQGGMWWKCGVFK